MTVNRTWARRSLFGVEIDAMSMDDVLSLVDRTIAERSRLLIGVVNAAKLVNMRRDELLRDSVLTADIVMADGMAVVWALKLLRRRIPHRVAGIDLMDAMLRRGAGRGWRVYCLGATEEVSQKAAERMQADHPGIEIAGRRHGYFTTEQEPDIVAGIAESNADMIFVAMSPPKKERFLAQWFDKLNVPVCHGVGGAFDILAGKTRRAPDRWQRMGLEWLYRIVQEPRRMWRRYLITNTLFTLMLAQELGRALTGRRSAVGGSREAGGPRLNR